MVKKGDKKKNRKSGLVREEPETPLEWDPSETEIVEPAPVCEPDVEECIQPETSPYEGQAVTVLIGAGEKAYTISRSLVDQVPTLQPLIQDLSCQLNPDEWGGVCNNKSSILRLADVDEKVAHTLLHYLYTGQFEILQQVLPVWTSKRAAEYTRCVLAYRAAVTYKLGGLEEHAKRYIETFDEHTSIFEVIPLAREIFPHISEHSWFSRYLSLKIMNSFLVDEGIFTNEAYLSDFGKNSEFDRFLFKTMQEAYEMKVARLQRQLAERNPPINSTDGVVESPRCEEPIPEPTEQGKEEQVEHPLSARMRNAMAWRGRRSRIPDPEFERGFEEYTGPVDIDY
ncbi:hypothetical protein P175DRAFT_0553788 [Aspergillus ochraceoroseus IBT 24754]|uniref:BTB domain-containing protein n=1 Tax=Aspergillus ochraceoroseus IBT 24754 TaxID=1392256 RepID=A0A2T5M7I2_9EURO|nr:uncharacterized protein P175DRAFT_0553788 [Aspergillus ochraceoroseus IBT 24754]PTU24501.1 hypothetical protein P175DRAFT_0553788 [Aspergillus ochraceoroseus IBT 24754]